MLNRVIKKRSQATCEFERGVAQAQMPYENGKGAIQGGYRAQISAKEGYEITGSVDLDKFFEHNEPDAARWDYGIGLRHSDGTEMTFWVEPHPASSTGQTEKLERKLQWLKLKLLCASFSRIKRLHDLSVQEKFNPFCWLVSTGSAVRITAGSKEARRLALAGIRMPSRFLRLPE